MPIKLSTAANQKTFTPRVNIGDGWYPAVVAGLLLPKPGTPNPKLEYLVQVQLPNGRSNYVNTVPFTLTLHKDSPFFHLLKKLTQADTTEDLINWFRENRFVNENDEFDETMFIDYPVKAYVICRVNKKTQRHFNLVTEFDYAEDEYHLDTTRLIPSYWSKSHVLKLASGLEVASDNSFNPMDTANDNH